MIKQPHMYYTFADMNAAERLYYRDRAALWCERDDLMGQGMFAWIKHRKRIAQIDRAVEELDERIYVLQNADIFTAERLRNEQKVINF